MSTCFSLAEFPCLAVSRAILSFIFGLANTMTVNTKNVCYTARAIDDVVRIVA